MKTSNNKKILLAAVVVVIILFFLYVVFNRSDDFESEALLSSDVESSALQLSSSQIIQSEVFFLEQINRLQEVTLDDVSVLQNTRLQELVDNTVVIPEFSRGRNNPFSPIDARVLLESRQSNQ